MRAGLLVVALALVAVAVAWWCTAADTAAPHAATPSVAPAAERPAESPPAAPVERAPAAPMPEPVHEVVAPNAADPGVDASSDAVQPWRARFQVVDEREQPVAGARVVVWRVHGADLHRARRSSEGGKAFGGHGSESLATLVTDPGGYAETRVEFECVIAQATADGVGESGEQAALPAEGVAGVTKLVVEAPIQLFGVVLFADGTPAAGAQVTAAIQGFSSERTTRVNQPDPVTADADGRFVFAVHKHLGYGLRAELGGREALSQTVWVHSQDPAEVVLTFPGAITLSGFVLDAEGDAVAGATVTSWSEYRAGDPDQQLDDFEVVHAESDVEGRFTIPVRRHRRYQLVATAEGLAQNAPVWLEPSTSHPHAEARLVLRELASISGRVLRGDGSPFAGIKVSASAEQGLRGGAPPPNREELYGSPDAVTTGEDGGFVVRVHPDTTWTLSAFPSAANSRLMVPTHGIAPGRSDVVLTIDAAHAAGGVVRGRVLRGDSTPVAAYRVDVVDYENGEPHGSSAATGTFEPGRFVLEPLPLGAQFALRVTAVPDAGDGARGASTLAPTTLGPFTVDGAAREFEFRLVEFGEVPVLVLAANGAAARDVRVLVKSVVWTGFRSSSPVDAAGRLVVTHCAPGPSRVVVFDASGALAEQELLVTPGPNAEVVVRLPAR